MTAAPATSPRPFSGMAGRARHRATPSPVFRRKTATGSSPSSTRCKRSRCFSWLGGSPNSYSHLISRDKLSRVGKSMQNQQIPKAPVGRLSRFIPGHMKLPLMIAGGIAACLALALLAVNLVISADWVRDRVAARIKEETGRDLKVNGTTALLFAPGPRIVITDATITDPEARAGTADFSISRLSINLSLGELLSRQIDAERVV